MLFEFIPERNKIHSIHKIFSLFGDFKIFIFIFGLAIWAIIPLLGIVFILAYCQINISQNKILGNHKRVFNIFPILLVLFTITTYIASFEPFLDTIVYLDIYSGLHNETGLTIPDIELEPISFILPKYLSTLIGPSQLSFFFLQSLSMNTAFTVFSMLFMPNFYPLIILINVTTQGYYFQLFWMRQIYSWIFIIPAIYVDNFVIACLCIYVGYWTHKSSLMYIFGILPGIFKYKFINALNPLKSFSKYFNNKFGVIICFGLILLFSSVIMKSLLSFTSALSSFDGSVSQKLDTYGGGGDDSSFGDKIKNQIRPILDYTIISIFIFRSDLSKINRIHSKTNRRYIRWITTFFLLFLLYFGSLTYGFNLRITSIFFCIPGFFYIIALSSDKLDDVYS
ncbi:hypothetical protein COO91_03777 [Nostoc flagelliforme CCNUN1]|uniref:Uncharacterized protein n=1 Tax=Nostoc flagelliforme CCNUN1 TaxID=2038116 RepID=A0A2K8SSQ9_9NOSO|nr:hypothetical protein [Nostoc flagelliforme]AUB37825.1 hypothetical protein COO91_03777 [Nostoc flagelliforme CCNUN1]